MTHFYSHITNQHLGKLLLLSNGTKLIGLYFADQKHAPKIDASWKREPALEIFTRTEQQLNEFVHGTRNQFDLPCAFTGTPFQQSVWQELTQISHSSTISYQKLATTIGKSNGVRAVANAVGKNPISIIVPCHRVVGKNGKLTGYAGGLERKKFLLRLENKIFNFYRKDY